MIDILTIEQGDIIEYRCLVCSESLKNERYTGIYQDFMFWSPDERPIEMWLNLIGQGNHKAGLRISIRASQVTKVFRSSTK
ncbi:MAG TPA: hypothetical protein VHV10_01275 [Ktedonobacteraceae bacterium]|jgi:hypothetical protein|nr:hypothetical protein [Ktedonobacteraceae bacterium]